MNQDLDALPLPEPLAFIHTGDDYGGERDDPDIEVNSWKALLDFSMTKPCDTSVGLHPDDAIRAARREGYELAMSKMTEAIAAENEACAKLCDEQHDRARTSSGEARADACAGAIRARGLALASQPAQEQASDGEWHTQRFDAPVYPPDGTKSPFTVINLGAGKVQMGDSIHDSRLPALWFGTNGQGMGHEEILNREAKVGETLAVVTFANVEGLDVLLEVIQRIRREKFPEAVEQQQAGAAEVSDEQIVEALESAGVKFQRFMGGIGGTQDIWSTSGAQSVKKIAAGVRAILALKATAGGVA